jgi:integrase
VTGLRIGEAIGLRWEDVDANAVQVRRRFYRGGFSEPKSSSGRRTVPLAPTVAQALWKHRKTSRYAADADLVFANERGGPLHSSNYSRRILKPAVEAAQVPWATGFHVYRHTCASFLFRQKEQGGAGMSVRQVQEWLGHSSPTLTLSIYIHLIPGELTAPAELDAMLPPELPTAEPVAKEETATVALAGVS